MLGIAYCYLVICYFVEQSREQARNACDNERRHHRELSLFGPGEAPTRAGAASAESRQGVSQQGCFRENGLRLHGKPITTLNTMPKINVILFYHTAEKETMNSSVVN